MNIFKSITLVFVFLLISGCGDSKKPEEKSIYKRVKTEKKQVKQVNAKTPIDLNNKGIGPIKNYNFSSEVNLELANEGKQVFNSKCTACHNVNRRLIGPAMSGIYERRSVEWVLNIMLNPDQMLKEDPTAIALLKEYNNIILLEELLL